MATTDYRTDKPRLTDADGYRIPRLTQIVGPNLSKEDKAFNKREREKFEARYGDLEEQDGDEECEHCKRETPKARKSNTERTERQERPARRRVINLD